jgi:hypothetical protein
VGTAPLPGSIAYRWGDAKHQQKSPASFSYVPIAVFPAPANARGYHLARRLIEFWPGLESSNIGHFTNVLLPQRRILSLPRNWRFERPFLDYDSLVTL